MEPGATLLNMLPTMLLVEFVNSRPGSVELLASLPGWRSGGGGSNSAASRFSLFMKGEVPCGTCITISFW